MNEKIDPNGDYHPNTNSRCIIFNHTLVHAEYLPFQWLEPFCFGDIKDWNMFINLIILLNMRPFLFPTGLGFYM